MKYQLWYTEDDGYSAQSWYSRLDPDVPHHKLVAIRDDYNKRYYRLKRRYWIKAV